MKLLSWHRLLLVVAVLSTLSVQGLTQSAQLRVVNTGPAGEIRQLDDANEIRVIFSEPMVALGRIPAHPTPDWIHITPAITGTYRWSGTTMLIFTPAVPLPYATRYTITIDAAAVSEAGRRLDSPATFTFTTPTVKLTSLRWYRRENRFDRPVVLLLEFNQPVRPDAIASHVAVTHEPHTWDAPRDDGA